MHKASENYNIISLKEAKNILLTIEFGKDVTLEQVNEVIEKIQSNLDEEVDIVFAAIRNEKLEDYLKIAVVGTMS